MHAETLAYTSWHQEDGCEYIKFEIDIPPEEAWDIAILTRTDGLAVCRGFAKLQRMWLQDWYNRRHKANAFRWIGEWQNTMENEKKKVNEAKANKRRKRREKQKYGKAKKPEARRRKKADKQNVVGRMNAYGGEGPDLKACMQVILKPEYCREEGMPTVLIPRCYMLARMWNKINRKEELGNTGTIEQTSSK